MKQREKTGWIDSMGVNIVEGDFVNVEKCERGKHWTGAEDWILVAQYVIIYRARRFMAIGYETSGTLIFKKWVWKMYPNDEQYVFRLIISDKNPFVSHATNS